MSVLIDLPTVPLRACYVGPGSHNIQLIASVTHNGEYIRKPAMQRDG